MFCDCLQDTEDFASTNTKLHWNALSPDLTVSSPPLQLLLHTLKEQGCPNAPCRNGQGLTPEDHPSTHLFQI